MVAGAQVLAIVPARGGSKGMPRKNIRLLRGIPLIAYAIEAALQARLIHRTIVSTDDETIAEIGRNWGAEVPFLRPPELAQDDSTDMPFFEHALGWLEDEEGYRPDILAQLRPTSPIRPKGLVDQAISLLIDNPTADSVRGVVPSKQNPYKMWRIGEDGSMSGLMSHEFSEPYNMPRQKLPAAYWQTGQIDVIRYSTITDKNSLSGDVILPVEVDPDYATDIDTAKDLKQAESVLDKKGLDVVIPRTRPSSNDGPRLTVPRPIPLNVRALVLDFDGVLTDNRVWTTQDGVESVASDRSDGMGLALLQERGIQVHVLSSEANPVVAARCRKLKVDSLVTRPV